MMGCVEGQGSGKVAMAPAKERSGRFAVTCGLLSRYLWENRGGALQGLDMATAAGAFQPPTTMNLLSGLEEPKPNTVDVVLSADKGQLLEEGEQEHAEQLTIFYAGKVVVVDNFPSTKVKALLQMANAAGGDGAVAVPQSLPGPAHGNLPADLPIARRNSLHRFLEKRKGRITAKAPYQVSTSSAAPSKQANGDNSWLGLGQEAAIKQEI